MEGYGANPYGDRHAGVYDDWYGADGGIAISQVGSPEDVATAVADLAAGGAVLELGVGTGRLALPIADRGLDVTGLDASSAMLDVLRAKPGAERLTLVEGDMACPDPSRTGLADGSFSLVLIGFNTLFNLTSEAAQVACVTHVARLLRPGGRFVLEAFVPDPGAHDGMSVRSVELDRVLLDVTVTDLDGQVITGQPIEIGGLDILLAVTSEVHGEILADNPEDIGLVGGVRLAKREGEQQTQPSGKPLGQVPGVGFSR